MAITRLSCWALSVQEMHKRVTLVSPRLQPLPEEKGGSAEVGKRWNKVERYDCPSQCVFAVFCIVENVITFAY